MKYLLIALVLALAIVGCAWQPSRDNPVDPDSPNYVQQRTNHAPEIDTVIVISDCRGSAFSYFCAFEVQAKAHDADGNMRYDHLSADVELGPGQWSNLGFMAYNPREGQFWIRATQDDAVLQGYSLADLVGHRVRVTVIDDSAASDQHIVLFSELVTDFPQLVHPSGFATRMDTLETSYPQFGWAVWSPSQQGYKYSVEVLYQNTYVVWDTFGLPQTDTSLVITDSLSASNILTDIFYAWYLTVTDNRGNRVTSLPGLFLILLPNPAQAPADSLPEMYSESRKHQG